MMIQMLHEDLRNDGKALVKTAEEYLDVVKSIYNTVDSLGDTWKGKDDVAYADKINGYKANINALGQVIANYGVFIQETANDLEEEQNKIASGASRL